MRTRRSRLFGFMVVGGLALTGCGGDDAAGGGSVQDQVADMLIDAMNQGMDSEDVSGIDIDEDCVRDAMQQLSDEDAQKLLDAGPDGDPDVSDDAADAADAFIDCVEIDFGEVTVDG